MTRPDGNGTNWRIVDTILGGSASELASRRAEYDGLFKKLGIDGVTRALRDKNAKLADGCAARKPPPLIPIGRRQRAGPRADQGRKEIGTTTCRERGGAYG